MQCIIKDFKVDVLPFKGVPNSRYYVPNGIGENIDEYVTDKEGNFHKVCCSEGGTSDPLRFGVEGEDDTAGEDREYTLTGFKFDLFASTGTDFFIDATSGNSEIWMEARNTTGTLTPNAQAYVDIFADGEGNTYVDISARSLIANDTVEVYMEPGLLYFFLDNNTEWNVDGLTQDDTATRVLAWDASNNVVWVDKASISGGATFRFAVPGEDDTQTQNREFLTEGYWFDIHDNNSYGLELYLDASNSNGSRDIYSYVENTVVNDGRYAFIDLFANSTGTPSIDIFIGGNNSDSVEIEMQPGRLDVYLETNSELFISGIDQDDTITQILGLNGSNQVRWVDKATLGSGGSFRFGVSGEDDTATQIRDFGLGNNYIILHDTSLGAQFYIDATSGGGNRSIYSQVQNTVIGDERMAYILLEADGAGEPSAYIFVAGLSANSNSVNARLVPGTFALNIGPNANLDFTGIDQDDSTERVLSLDINNHVRWIDKASITGGGGYSNEQAQDTVFGAIVDGAGIVTSYNDVGNTFTISHADTSSVADLDTTAAQVIDTLTFDTFGHVQTVTTRNLTLADLGYTVPTTGQRFGVAGEDATATQNRNFDLGTTFAWQLNSLTNYYLIGGGSGGGMYTSTYYSDAFGAYAGYAANAGYNSFFSGNAVGSSNLTLDVNSANTQLFSEQTDSGVNIKGYLNIFSNGIDANSYTQLDRAVTVGAGAHGRFRADNTGAMLQAKSTLAGTYKGILVKPNTDLVFENYPSTRADAGSTKAFYAADASGTVAYGPISSTTGQRFGKSGEDTTAGEDRTFALGSSWDFRVTAAASTMLMQEYFWGANMNDGGGYEGDIENSIYSFFMNAQETGVTYSRIQGFYDDLVISNVAVNNKAATIELYAAPTDSLAKLEIRLNNGGLGANTWGSKIRMEDDGLYLQTSTNPNAEIYKGIAVALNGNVTVDTLGASGDVIVGASNTGLLSKVSYADVVAGGQVVIFDWKFDVSVGVNNPGSGNWRADSAVGASVVTLSINDITSTTGLDISALFAQVDGNWLIHIQQSNDATKFIQFTTSGTYIDHTTWWEVPVTYVQSSGFPFSNNTKCTFVFINENNSGSSGGITRTIVSTSGSITLGAAASTDYMYFVTGAHTMSMPAAAGNTNRYTIKNNHSANITVDTAGAENIEGAASLSLAPNSSIDVISNGTNWFII